jgi:hypothetical protein
MVKLKINGENISVDLQELLEIVDISGDMNKVAALMGRWGALCAEAESEKMLVDMHYRKWRAEITQSIMEAEPKLAEWKVRSKIEASSDFEKIKIAIAQSIKNYSTARYIYGSLLEKAHMLQSKGAMMRFELDSTSMTTKTSAAKKTSDDMALKEAKMIEINKRKKIKK